MADGPKKAFVGIRIAAGLAAALGVACANPGSPYRPTESYQAERQHVIEGDTAQLEVGKPNALIDGLNHYLLSLPVKLILWNWQALDHKLPERSAELLLHYVDVNDLRSVKIRHNQYDPLGEFSRLRRNQNIGAGYRYTFGMINWVLYTVFPGRLFAGVPLIGPGDHFNPFTNSINVYSSDPTILLHEGGHAKDYIEHPSRGTSFALARIIPGMDLVQEATASHDALHFLQCAGEEEVELRAYRTLYPAYSTYVAGYVPGGFLAAIPVIVSGHVVGRVQSYRRSDQLENEKYLESLAGTVDLSPCEADRFVAHP